MSIFRTQSKDERIFSYRLSRARRVVENAFGILSNKWRCLLTCLEQNPETVEKMVLTCCILHNIVRNKNIAHAPPDADREDPDGAIIPGAWRNNRNMQDCNPPVGGNIDYKIAKAQRDTLKHYYNSIGAVPWQDTMIRAELYH